MGLAVGRASRAGLNVITTQVGPRPADFADVRTTNLAVVLRYVRANAPCSRADIAASTGLNKATVSSLVAELIERRLVRETGLAEQRIGRPATLLVLDGAPYAAVGIAIDVDHLTVIATDLAGERLLSWHRAFHSRDALPGKAIASIAALAKRATTRLGSAGRQVLGLTIAVPGLVDPTGDVRFAPGLRWHDVELPGLLQRAMRRPSFQITVENYANLAALAEHRYGAHHVGNLAHLSGGGRIGAGIIAEGQLLRGGLGFAGELSHLLVDGSGAACDCGRQGCLEAVAGIPAMIKRLSPRDLPEDALVDGDPLDLQPEVEDLARRARSGEPAVLEELERGGTALGYASWVLASVVNPEVVVLGGHYAALARWLLPAAEAELTSRIVTADGEGANARCRLVASVLGQDASAIGAAARVLDTVDSGQVQTLRAG
ncbi:MAG: ROK family transcriptional regulator [Dactylosporangium sp.]|nr:ROK family transcriptional regulator [Dactylosporangium sp.]NNJ63580.1 ROK family transcriptional regulator [Dactylosporangium sp.]